MFARAPAILASSSPKHRTPLPCTPNAPGCHVFTRLPLSPALKSPIIRGPLFQLGRLLLKRTSRPIAAKSHRRFAKVRVVLRSCLLEAIKHIYIYIYIYIYSFLIPARTPGTPPNWRPRTPLRRTQRSDHEFKIKNAVQKSATAWRWVGVPVLPQVAKSQICFAPAWAAVCGG